MNQEEVYIAPQTKPRKPRVQSVSTDEEESDLEELTTILPEEITVAIFCALSCESVAVRYSLDKEFQCNPKSGRQKYVYSFGQIGEHKVVVARPTQIGKVNAAQISATVSLQFPSVRFALMIGIGAGIPLKRDIRLGDVVVSIPKEDHPGVLEYDFGKAEKDGFILKGSLNKPPSILLSADGQLEDDERMNKKTMRRILRTITEKPGYGRPSNVDILFDSVFHHVKKGEDCSECEASSERKDVQRVPRQWGGGHPVVHRGLILSGSLVIKNSEDRDILRRGHEDAICYEMEAAGIMDEIPCLVIRGISDYADTHKQDMWQCYAAATAASYGKAILCKINGGELEETITIRENLLKIEQKIDAANESVAGLRNAVQYTSEVMQGVALSQQAVRHKEILEWLSPGNVSSRHSTVITAREAGTGDWFLYLKEFSNWSKYSGSSSGILWCNGIPGAGKSTISSVVIEHLEEVRRKDTTLQTAVAYFYFDFSNKTIDIRNFTRNLLKQLAFHSPQIPQGLVELFESYYASGKTELENQRIEDLLIETISKFKTTYIVVDALDECDPEQRFYVLQIFQKLASAGAKVFATSRPHPEDINEALNEARKIELSADADDIKKYINAEIARHQRSAPRARQIHSELRSHIVESLTRKSNGMFLLPKLQLKFLLKQASLHRIEIALEKILQTSTSKDFHPIDGTFDLMFDSIDEWNKDIAHKALSWLATVKKPLQVQDLLAALVVEPGVFEKPLSYQVLESTVLDICAGFIVVNQTSGIAELAHETIQEYLLRVHVNHAKALASLTSACLGYLSFKQFADVEFWNSLGDSAALWLKGVTNIPFYLYSVQNWEAQIADCDQDAIENDLVAFLKRRRSLLSYCLARKLVFRSWPTLDFFYRIGTDESPLHVAARVGHLNCIKYFIAEGGDIDIKHNGNQTPIWEAVSFGRSRAVKLLIESGSSPRTPGIAENRLMNVAAALGYSEIVKYLLEVSGETVNLQNTQGLTPLHESAYRGHEKIVHMLLSAGANWRLQTKRSKNTAFLALEYGWSDIFLIWLKEGINLEDPLSEGICNSGTALHVAALYNHEGIVREIISRITADGVASLSDTAGNTALHNAIISGSLTIVKMLVEKGIDIRKKNGDGRTALELARDFRFVSIEKYLRDSVSKIQNINGELNSDTSVEDESTTLLECRPALQSKISPADIAETHSILTRNLNIPPLLAKKILDYASYWVEQYTKKSGTVTVDMNSLPIPYLHLNICRPFVRKVVIRTVTHDQGWSNFKQWHGTYEHSSAWIELSVRPASTDGNKSTEHINIWDVAVANDSGLDDFLSNLKVGDRITISPKAEYPGWKCYLIEAEMWIYSSIWESPFPTPSGQKTRAIKSSSAIIVPSDKSEALTRPSSALKSVDLPSREDESATAESEETKEEPIEMSTETKQGDKRGNSEKKDIGEKDRKISKRGKSFWRRLTGRKKT
ncbi:hypothetical protein H072_2627 [Dactylellina haptotyla CBS 200.50]|uniref:Uncharacterized protein n=1 Tax=Dactylellina haptotyla (strain CBS 200.50) TaxID=1284197 RepID=S8C6Q7_DACHA|nr:hypothetical protein H072_2627 [Dactylellina haptotyla CBS 200.50]